MGGPGYYDRRSLSVLYCPKRHGCPRHGPHAPGDEGLAAGHGLTGAGHGPTGHGLTGHGPTGPGLGLIGLFGRLGLMCPERQSTQLVLAGRDMPPQPAELPAALVDCSWVVLGLPSELF